ncbi:hypothetical protein CUR178_04971 [Leishmania enriettii]|uniref:Zinc finger PHD-type domain-containing protein n=1 Tax=Leishmania enriettii TaxID=5663 RepID=A0A836HI16_LEIEN|nr:hypothetical protein CUR178_04971 [Leishmania enriettii]
MPRGRSRGRGRTGRSRGAAAVTGDEAVSSSPRPLITEAAVTVLSARGCSGRGRGRGRSQTGRGSALGVALGRGGRRAVTLESVSSSSEASKSANVADLPASSAPLALEASPLPAAQEAAVVVVVPQGRMITRSLLRGTTSLLLDSYSDAAGSPVVSPLDGRRRRRTEGAAASTSSLSPASSSTTAMAGGTASSVDGSEGHPSSLSRRVVIGGLLRCVCSAFLVSPSETLLECCRCRNWCHPACVGVDYEELRLRQRQRDFICPFCVVASTPASVPTSLSHTAAASITTSLGESVKVVLSSVTPSTTTHASVAPAQILDLTAAAAVNGVAAAPTGDSNGTGYVAVAERSVPPVSTPPSEGDSPLSSFSVVKRQPPAPRQLPLKLREVPDQPPPAPLADELRRLIRTVDDTARRLGYSMLHLPAHTLTEQQATECLECCTEAIQSATFSADYPAYCLKEVQNHWHPYVQGIALQSQADGRICSLILSSGRDLYGNLKSTITQLKSSLQRGLLKPSALTPFMAECLAIVDVADFVHITLSATHSQHQRKGLARLLMTMELLKWSLRGRHRAFLNMAIEKRLVDGSSRIEFSSPIASKRLYESFGFVEVYPRYDPVTREERWTAKEADMGRVMANLNFVDHVRAVAEAIPAKHNVSGNLNGDGVGRGGHRQEAVVPTTTCSRGGKDMDDSAEETDLIARENGVSRSRSERRAGSARKRSSSTASQGGDDSDSERHNRVARWRPRLYQE